MAHRYLAAFFFTLLAGLGATIGWVKSVDVFGVYHAQSEESLSRINQFWFMRTSKPLRLENSGADVVVLGSSRAARISPARIGLDNGFNAAIPGATGQEIEAYLRFSAQTLSASAVVVGLDFDSFLASQPASREGTDLALLRLEGLPAYLVAALELRKYLLFSPVALMQTYTATRAPLENDARYQPDGSWHRLSSARPRGASFRSISRQKIAFYREKNPLDIDVGAFERMLRICHEEQIECHFFVSPVHALQLVLFGELGVTETWQRWLRALADVNERVAAEFDRDAYPLWGFEIFEPAVGEALAPKQAGEVEWFKDNVHYRPAFADLILQTLIGDAAGSDERPGQRLTSDSVDSYVAEVERVKQAFTEREREQVMRLLRRLGVE